MSEPIRYAKNRAAVFAAQDRRAGKVKLALRYRAGATVGLWPGEEYGDWSEALEQAERFRQRFPGAEFEVEEVKG